jgi:hypothetical protein
MNKYEKSVILCKHFKSTNEKIQHVTNEKKNTEA